MSIWGNKCRLNIFSFNVLLPASPLLLFSSWASWPDFHVISSYEAIRRIIFILMSLFC